MNAPLNPNDTQVVTNRSTELGSILAASKAGRKKGRWRRWLTAVVVLLLAGGAAAYFYVGRGANKYSYTTQPVKRGDMTVLVTATGSVQPTQKVDISSELSGTMRDVNVDFNSTV